MTITIDPEFSSLIPPLTDEEYDGLEKSVAEEGCRDALVIWNHDGKQILIDGHNRYRICQKHGIEFKTIEKEFENRNKVKAWMAITQLGRRNLSAYDRTTLALVYEQAIAEINKEAQKRKPKDFVPQKSAEQKEDNQKRSNEHELYTAHVSQSPENHRTSTSTVNVQVADTTAEEIRKKRKEAAGRETREQIAKIAGVSRDTVQKVKVINEKGSEQLKQQVRNGDKSINGAFNEIVKKESKRLPTASEYREQAQARHEELKDQKIVSVQEIARDKRDVALLSSEIRADIARAVKPIDRLYVLLSSKELDVSMLTDADKRMAITNVKQATSLLDQIANIIEKG